MQRAGVRDHGPGKFVSGRPRQLMEMKENNRCSI
jgi:hypothetical protein